MKNAAGHVGSDPHGECVVALGGDVDGVILTPSRHNAASLLWSHCCSECSEYHSGTRFPAASLPLPAGRAVYEQHWRIMPMQTDRAYLPEPVAGTRNSPRCGV